MSLAQAPPLEFLLTRQELGRLSHPRTPGRSTSTVMGMAYFKSQETEEVLVR